MFFSNEFLTLFSVRSELLTLIRPGVRNEFLKFFDNNYWMRNCTQTRSLLSSLCLILGGSCLPWLALLPHLCSCRYFNSFVLSGHTAPSGSEHAAQKTNCKSAPEQSPGAGAGCSSAHGPVRKALHETMPWVSYIMRHAFGRCLTGPMAGGYWARSDWLSSFVVHWYGLTFTSSFSGISAPSAAV